MVLLSFAAALSTGCFNRQGATNPFLSADRVPPPQGVLAPGAAQPYYAGDPLTGGSGARPATTPFAPSVFPPAGQLQTVPPATAPFPQVSPGQPVFQQPIQQPFQQPFQQQFQPAPQQAFPQQTLPGGSSSREPIGGQPITAGIAEAAVQVPSDNAELRLAQAPLPIAISQPVTPLSSPAPAGPQAFVAVPTPPATPPIAVTLSPVAPFAGDTRVSTPTSTEFSAPTRSADGLAWNSGSAPQPPITPFNPGVQQAAFQTAVPRVRLPGAPTTGRVQITELPAASTIAPPDAAAPAADGFRARTIGP